MLKVYPRTLTRRDIPSVVIDETVTTPNDIVRGNPEIAELSGKWSIDGTTIDAGQMDKPFSQVFDELGIPCGDVCYLSNVPDGKNA